jgi:hypothetical protein
MSAKYDLCVDRRRRIIEGTQFTPVWISSLFVEYAGSPLTIRSELVNSAPRIAAQDQTVMVGDPVNLRSFASAYDPEEGDLSNRITVKSNYADLAGIYAVTYTVADKYGYSATKSIRLTVVEPDNTPPYISAHNQSVLQYTAFDPLLDVFASDFEEGNLTSQISVLGEVDTRDLGEYLVCYHVADSKGLSHERCIQVTVYAYVQTFARFRSLSLIKPFHQEPIPSLWIHHYTVIQSVQKRMTPIISTQIKKKPR